jgi:DNA modification methylase
MTSPIIREVTIGNCRLIQGDCLKVMPLLGKVDACVTDPPYGIGADRNLRANKKHGKAAAPSRDYGTGDWDKAPPDADTINAIIDRAFVSVLWGGNYFGLPASSCWLVWDKENGTNGYADCELAWTNLPRAVRRIKWRWAGMLQQDMANKEDRVHPTQKPLEVMRWSIEQCRDAQTILDPFMGSGTTLVACAKLGRHGIGIEIDPDYFDIACERVRKAYEQPDMFIAQPEPKPVQEPLL